VKKITTHVLDTSSGKPAVGVEISLYFEGSLVAQDLTNEDGRCAAPLIEDASAGAYLLEFAIGDYFRRQGVDSPFLDKVPIQFSTLAGESYHVPLVCTPWSYSTYRGS